MIDTYDIIIKPIITEKTSRLMGEGKYVFQVHPKANKIEVRKAVEAVFKVRVKDVNLMNMKGKKKRLGRYEGKRPDWKKAIVTLHEGERIPFFEGLST